MQPCGPATHLPWLPPRAGGVGPPGADRAQWAHTSQAPLSGEGLQLSGSQFSVSQSCPNTWGVTYKEWPGPSPDLQDAAGAPGPYSGEGPSQPISHPGDSSGFDLKVGRAQ